MLQTRRARLVAIALLAIVGSLTLRYGWVTDSRVEGEMAEASRMLAVALANVEPRDVNLATGDLDVMLGAVPGRVLSASKPTPDSLRVEIAVGTLGTHRCVIGTVGPGPAAVAVLRGSC